MKYRLKELREDNDIKQQELADILHMTRQNYARIENETICLSFDDAIILADYYGISLEELITRRPKGVLITKEEYKQIKKTASLLLELENRMKE